MNADQSLSYTQDQELSLFYPNEKKSILHTPYQPIEKI